MNLVRTFRSLAKTRLSQGSTFYSRYYASLIVKVPPMAESITEGALGSWEKKIGDHVSRDELVANIETDKITLPVNAPESGVLLEVYAQPGDTVAVGADLYKLDVDTTTVAQGKSPSPKEEAKKEEPPKKETVSKKAESIPMTEILPTLVSAPAAPFKPTNSASSSIHTMSISAGGDVSLGFARSEKVTKMTLMRLRIAQRLKESQETAASLTTFNEVDMSALMDMRSLYKDEILKKHGVKFGFMSPFIKASAIVLQEIPIINSRVQDDTLIQPNYVDISAAVATPKGLVTPVLRDCQFLSLLDIEKNMALLSEKARSGQLSMADLTGGTFTLSNGGVFGSLMGTPIINVPQSAILGMHAIKDRPVALNGQVVIRPMMNLALTYDHRIIDGREAVSFLVRLKQLLEDPRRLLLDI